MNYLFHIIRLKKNGYNYVWDLIFIKLQIINNNIQDNLNIEKERWRSILKRIIACIEFLAEHNDAFRGTSSKLYTPNNGKFLGLIQMITKFDIIMADHLRRVCNDENYMIIIQDLGFKTNLLVLLPQKYVMK